MAGMDEWTRVKWTEAGQVTRLLGWEESAAAEAMRPAEFLAQLRANRRWTPAIAFLAQALPRFEAVTWAVRFVRDSEPAAGPETPEGVALKSALLWLQDPCDERRRTAFAAARAASGAEAMAAMAVFYSGGSVAPANCEPLPAPHHLAGRCAAAAVTLACVRSAHQERAMMAALEAGVRFAHEDPGGPVAP